MHGTNMKTVMQSMRLPFLLLTPAILVLAFGLAKQAGSDLHWLDLTLIMVAGIAAHISVNCLNEYADFRSGLDLNTERTPFSGGSGGLPANPSAAKAVFIAGIIALVVCTLIGLYYIQIFGYELLLLGTVGALIIVAYTPLLNRHAWACLVAPGLSFGPLMIMGAWYVLVGEFDWAPLLVSLVPFFLVNNLLLLNQFPDVEADRQSGRKHFVISYGYQFSAYMFGMQAMAAIFVLLGSIVNGYVAPLSIVVLLPLGLQLVAFYGANKHQHNIAALAPYMAMNVASNILTPLVFGLVLLLV